MRSLCIIAVLLLACSARLSGDIAWTKIESDLPLDPAAREGRLPNGLRYLVERTAEPPRSIAFRLVVAAGSRNEGRGEEGAAHLVEHMAFRKSLDPSIETVRQELERRGVASGPNLTAFTFFDHTVYNVDLPANDAESRRLALRLLRAYADSVAFDEKELELERDIVLNEDTLHKNQGSVIQTELNRIIWPDRPQLSRTVGGSDTAIRSLKAKDCSRFYRAWYRPENLAVIVAGDFQPEEMVGEIEKAFESMTGAGGPAPALPPQREVSAAKNGASRFTLLAISNPSDIFLRFFNAWSEPSPFRWDKERRLRDLKRQLAMQMFNERLYRKSRRAGAVIDHPSAEIVTPVPDCNAVLYSARCNPSDWQTAFAAAEQELRRALLFGFFPEELEKAKKNWRRNQLQAISYRPSITAAYEANRLKAALVGGYEIVAPQARWDATKEQGDTITAHECTAAFRQLWGDAPPQAIVAVSGSLELEASQILRALKRAEREELKPEPPATPHAFAYDDFGPPGRTVEESTVADLDIRSVRFANGVNFNFKRTDFERDIAEVYLRFGSGRQSAPPNRTALDLVASIALWEGGVGKHSAEELGLLLEAELLTFNFTVEDDAFCFYVRGPSESIETGLKIIAAFMTDAAFRPSSMTAVRAALDAYYLRLSNTPMGRITAKMEHLLASGSERFGVGDLDDAQSRTMAEVENWLKPALSAGPVELGIVGDMSYEKARDAVANTLGALQERPERRMPEEKLSILRAHPQTYRLFTSPGVAQSAVSLVWFTRENMDAPEERRYSMIADILSARVREGLREKLGAAYVTDADVVNHECYSNFSYLQIYMFVDTARVPEAIHTVLQEIARLQSEGLNADEFERIRQPFIATYEQSQRTNSYWGYRVLRILRENPISIVNARGRNADVRNIRLNELVESIRSDLKIDRCHIFFTIPTPPR